MYRNRIAQLAVAAGLLSVAACKDNWPTTPLGASSASAGRSITPTWEKTVTGITGEGAQYSVFVPANWNGDVVYYAHGIKDVAEPIALPVTTGFPEFRDSLGVMGYAVATSSFSENGWAVQDGMQKTHQLRAMKRALGKLVASCASERSPRHCPILEALDDGKERRR